MKRTQRAPFIHFAQIAFAVFTLSSCDSKTTVSDVQHSNSLPASSSASSTNTEIPSSSSVSSVSSSSNLDEVSISERWPPSGAERIALISPITLSFSQELLAGSYDDQFISLLENGKRVGGELHSQNNRQFTFTPDLKLQPNTLYQVHIAAGAMSVHGVDIQEESWVFETVGDVHTTPQEVIDSCMSDRDIAMLASVNQARTENRSCGEDFYPATEKLTWNCRIQIAAAAHAQDMAENDFFSHTGSDGSAASTRISRAGYVWSWAGENIAAGQYSVNDVMIGWLDSPGHCANIMSPAFSEFGFAYAENDDSYYTRYWVQNFARPR